MSSAALWEFSLALYAMEGVASASLRCQDEAGADVNLLLFLLWHAGDGVALDESEIEAIDAKVKEWRAHVVQKLRAVRRALKGTGEDSLRAQVAAAELEAERVEQARLAAHAATAAPPAQRLPPAAAARASLAAYARVLGCPLPAEATGILLASFVRHRAHPEKR